MFVRKIDSNKASVFKDIALLINLNNIQEQSVCLFSSQHIWSLCRWIIPFPFLLHSFIFGLLIWNSALVLEDVIIGTIYHSIWRNPSSLSLSLNRLETEEMLSDPNL